MGILNNKFSAKQTRVAVSGAETNEEKWLQGPKLVEDLRILGCFQWNTIDDWWVPLNLFGNWISENLLFGRAAAQWTIGLPRARVWSFFVFAVDQSPGRIYEENHQVFSRYQQTVNAEGRTLLCQSFGDSRRSFLSPYSQQSSLELYCRESHSHCACAKVSSTEDQS